MKGQNKQYPEGHFIGIWIGIGIAIFTGLGIPLSIATGNPGLIGIGPAIGVSIGVAIGVSIESKHKKEGKIRPLTDVERRKQKKTISYILGIGILLILTFAVLFIALK